MSDENKSRSVKGGGMSDRTLEKRLSQFTVDDNGDFESGNRSAFLTVKRELARRAERQAASEAAFIGPRIKREVESPTAQHSAELKSAQVEFFTLQGSFSSIDGGGGQANNVGGLPEGTAGDILFHNGTNWVVLTAPSVSDEDAVLRHNGTAPYWETPGCD
jgi:hypothetical protein